MLSIARGTPNFGTSRRAPNRELWVGPTIHGGGSSKSHHVGRPNGRRYRPGETVRQSGIYEVLHDREHREAHEAVMISGERFPDCESCKEKVRFRLLRTAPYIFQDEDFEEES